MDELINISDLRRKLERFASERDWNQFHNPKNISMALSVETSELLEIFQWVDGNASREESFLHKNKEAISDEIADVFLYLLRLSTLCGVNFEKSIKNKMIKNEQKYPAELVKGSSKKYTEYKK